MNGFDRYIPHTESLKRLDPTNTILRYPQKGNGSTSSVKIVSPTEQVLDQAKESLKRNKEEIQENKSQNSPKKLKGNPKVTKKAKALISKSSKKSPQKKAQKIHNRYKHK